MNKDQTLYLVVEQTTGLLDGYYVHKEHAIKAKKYFEKEVAGFKCIVKETKYTHDLKDCEMINCQDWYIKRYEKEIK